MRIPNKFKQVIKDTFYDKEVDLYSVTTEPDSDGFVRKGEPATKTGSFLGNVNFDKLDAIQEEYGIDQDIDITISTDEDVSLDQVISYGGRFYKVIRAIQNDSHNLLIAQKCLLKSSTSISA